ncbi:MAG: MaoC family dehydratase [Actinophytocola sp.]|uniref:MaoC family dehydratase n=1 Tax=Actinophytocola sp. TaxID=1872138 RepID=UPI003C77A482
MRIFANLDEFAAAKGEQLGHGTWHTVTQEQVNTFADATGDHQWIHVDTEKAAQGPFGATIAHGYLTLSLIPFLGKEIYRVDGLAMGINYGLGKVRFPSVVPVGARIRAGAELIDISDRPQGKQATLRWTVEIDGGEKPACVAETIVVYVP